MKALFVLVDPVERMFAHYRQLRAQFHLLRCDNRTTAADSNNNNNNSNTSFPSFEDLALEAMQYSTVFSQVREMVTNGTALDFIVHYYFQQVGVDVDENIINRRWSKDPCGETRTTGQKNDMNSFMAPAYSLFANSVYFPAIVHYLNKLGPDRVRIVFVSSSILGNGENSSLSSAATSSISGDLLMRSGPLPLQDIANEVFQFLELCPFEVSATENIPPSPSLNSSDAPPSNRRLLDNSTEDDDYDGLSEKNHSRADRGISRPSPSDSGEEGNSVSMSREIFQKLSAFFEPLQVLLTNVTVDYNISIGSPPPFPSPLLSAEFSAFSNETISLPLLWFEDQGSGLKDETSLIGRLMPKLIPQR